MTIPAFLQGLADGVMFRDPTPGVTPYGQRLEPFRRSIIPGKLRLMRVEDTLNKFRRADVDKVEARLAAFEAKVDNFERTIGEALIRGATR